MQIITTLLLLSYSLSFELYDVSEVFPYDQSDSMLISTNGAPANGCKCTDTAQYCFNADFMINCFNASPLGASNAAITAAYTIYKPCGCEHDRVRFCNYEGGTTGTCAECSIYSSKSECLNGLQRDGSIDCRVRCFGEFPPSAKNIVATDRFHKNQPCGCEEKGVKFCKFDVHALHSRRDLFKNTCCKCSMHKTRSDCFTGGFNLQGTWDCLVRCFSEDPHAALYDARKHFAPCGCEKWNATFCKTLAPSACDSCSNYATRADCLDPTLSRSAKYDCLFRCFQVQAYDMTLSVYNSEKPCGCEEKSVSFCNLTTATSGSCGQCTSVAQRNHCLIAGLTELGAADCMVRCFNFFPDAATKLAVTSVYKSQSPCWCELNGQRFCKFNYGTVGSCDLCTQYAQVNDCLSGLSATGAVDCMVRCFNEAVSVARTAVHIAGLTAKESKIEKTFKNVQSLQATN